MNPALSEHADDAGFSEPAFSIHMLMPVNERRGLGALEVDVESVETNVNRFVPLMNAARGIVGDENVDGRKRLQKFFDFELREEKIAARFVAPAAAEPAELDAADFDDVEVKIFDRRSERRGTVVIAFDGEHVTAERHFRHLQDE